MKVTQQVEMSTLGSEMMEEMMENEIVRMAVGRMTRMKLTRRERIRRLRRNEGKWDLVRGFILGNVSGLRALEEV